MSVVEQTTRSQAEMLPEAATPPANNRPTSAFVREIIETLLLTFFIF